jgi:hypothetical protein
LKLMGSIGYVVQRGVHLIRSRDLNVPDPSTGLFPFPNSGPVLQYESSGVLRRNELRVNLRTGFNSRFTMFANYILSSTHNDTDGAGTIPANPFDLASEYGRASYDQRHRFFVGSSITLPWDLRLAPYIFAASGRPFNIVTGQITALDPFLGARPAFASPGDTGAIVTPFGVFNPTPTPGEALIPRNFGNGPGIVSINLTVSKTIGLGKPVAAQPNAGVQGGRQRDRSGGGGDVAPPIAVGGGGRGPGGGAGGMGGGGFGGGGGSDSRYRYTLTFSLQGTNVINHTNLAGFNGVLDSPLFGLANRALDPRKIVLAVRFNF